MSTVATLKSANGRWLPASLLSILDRVLGKSASKAPEPAQLKLEELREVQRQLSLVIHGLAHKAGTQPPAGAVSAAVLYRQAVEIYERSVRFQAVEAIVAYEKAAASAARIEPVAPAPARLGLPPRKALENPTDCWEYLAYIEARQDGEGDHESLLSCLRLLCALERCVSAKISAILKSLSACGHLLDYVMKHRVWHLLHGAHPPRLSGPMGPINLPGVPA